VRAWKTPLKWLGNIAIVGGLVGVFLHYLRFGPKDEPKDDDEPAKQEAKS
jgi:Formate dehydrogenase N, transmembrane